MNNRALINLQNRLERLELEHLRQHSAELHDKLEQAEERALSAEESADFWQSHAMNLQEALHDKNFATHRSVGLNKSGELMVVQLN